MATSSSNEILKHVVHMANKMDTLCEDMNEIKLQIGNLSTVSGISRGGKYYLSVLWVKADYY